MVLDHVYISTAHLSLSVAFYMHKKEGIALHRNLSWLCLVHYLYFRPWSHLFVPTIGSKTFMYMFLPVGLPSTYILVLIPLLCILFVLFGLHAYVVLLIWRVHVLLVYGPDYLSTSLKWPCACFHWFPNHKPVCYQSVFDSIVLIMTLCLLLVLFVINLGWILLWIHACIFGHHDHFMSCFFLWIHTLPIHTPYIYIVRVS